MIEFEKGFYWFLFVFPTAFLIFSFIKYSNRTKTLSHLIKDIENKNNYIKQLKKGFFLDFIFTLGIIFLIITIMEPHWGIKSIERGEKRINLVFVLDNSYSMLAEDIYPSRFDKAKEIILKLANFYKEKDNLSLIIFAGDTEILVPPTSDFQSFSSFLINTTPEINSIQGSLLGKTLENLQNLACSSLNNSFFIILSDGESFDNSLKEKAEKIRKCGNEIFFIGIGSSEGAPIPIRNKEFKIMGWRKDAEGKTIITRLNTVSISNIAKNTKNYAIISNPMIRDKEIISKTKKAVKEFKKFKITIKKVNKSWYSLVLAFIFLFIYGALKYGEKG